MFSAGPENALYDRPEEVHFPIGETRCNKGCNLYILRSRKSVWYFDGVMLYSILKIKFLIEPVELFLKCTHRLIIAQCTFIR